MGVFSWHDSPPLRPLKTPDALPPLDLQETTGDTRPLPPESNRRNCQKLVTLGWRVRSSPTGSGYAFLEELGDESWGENSLPLGTGGQALNFERDFREGETIGSGSHGRVFTARHETTGRIVAVKETSVELDTAVSSLGGLPDVRSKPPTPKDMREKFDLRRSSVQCGTQEARLVNELRLCEKMQHPRIVKYLGYDLVPFGDKEGVYRLLLFQEYCSGGSVAENLWSYGPMTQVLVVKYAEQLVDGIAYLHSCTPCIVHRDLKGANLVLASDGSIKITDFGCSKNLGATSRHHSVVGTMFWMAPELLASTGIELSTASDIWSLGCCLIEMASGKAPWSECKFDNMFHAFRVIAQGDRTPKLPPQLEDPARDFVIMCLTRDPTKRPSAVDLQNHLLLVPQLE